MNVLFESRASIILYNFLSMMVKKKPFLLPSNICPIVPAVYLKLKIPFEVVDISLDTLEMDKKIILKKINKAPNKYSGMLWLRSYGVNNNNNNFFKSIKKINRNLLIIDDRCLMKPKFNNTLEYSDLIIYSTGYSKFVDFNWGGFGFIKNKDENYHTQKLSYNKNDLIDINRSFQSCIDNRTKFKYSDSKWLGGNMKFNYDNYKNKILFKLPKISKHKKTINSLYIKNISREAQLSEDYHNWRFNILVNNKNELIKSIFKKNLFVSNHYYPISKLINKGSCPNSDMIFNHIINLFNDKRYNKNMALSTIDIINNHISRWGTPEF